MGDIKKLAIQIIFILLVTVLGMFYTFNNGFRDWINARFSGGEQVSEQQQDRLKVGSVVVDIEISDSTSERAKGLGGRQSLASDSGMLFIFPKKDKYKFWMKGLKFGLDFIWIREGHVVDLVTHVPPPEEGMGDSALPIIQSQEDIDWVLEVNAGFVDANQVKIGDEATKL